MYWSVEEWIPRCHTEGAGGGYSPPGRTTAGPVRVPDAADRESGSAVWFLVDTAVGPTGVLRPHGEGRQPPCLPPPWRSACQRDPLSPSWRAPYVRGPPYPSRRSPCCPLQWCPCQRLVRHLDLACLRCTSACWLDLPRPYRRSPCSLVQCAGHLSSRP